MTDHNDSDIYLSYKSFIDGDEVQPPSFATDALRSQVTRDISPTARQVLMKFFTLHAAALAATLTVCPQFGLGPIGGGHGIMHLVMRYGETACAVFCAAVLFGVTLLFARFFMTRHEMRVTAERSFTTAIVVSSLSFAFFMLLDAVTPSVVVNIASGLVWTAAGAVILLMVRYFPVRRQQ